MLNNKNNKIIQINPCKFSGFVQNHDTLCVNLDNKLARNSYTFNFLSFRSFCYVSVTLPVILLLASANFLFLILQLDHVE